MADKPKASDIRKQYQDELELQKQLNELTSKELSTFEKIYSIRNIFIHAETDYNNMVAAAQAKAESYQKRIDDANQKGIKIHKATLKSLQDELDVDQKILKAQEKKANNEKLYLLLIGKTGKAMDSLWGYLMKSDKIIRSTYTALGMSGAKADMIRDSFEESAGYVARFGGSLEDIGTLMTTFADETGRAKVLSGQMVKDGMLISQATGMGAEAAGKMAGQFEIMGMNMTNTAKYVEGVMETSERMGVNSNKVFKVLSANFAKLQKYTFQGGVKAMAKMAQYGEKYKIDMSATLDSAEKARTLEGAVDMMANLQVMGGKFAQSDPFEMLYLSRNAPDEYMKKISEMTVGMAHFKKNMKDGSFENFISPVDMDRIRMVSKTLGIDETTLTQSARRMNEIQTMRRQMQGMGLTAEQKELIEGMGNFDKNTGRFTVEIAGASKDITKLTSDELKTLKGQKKSLEERAASAQTFDDTFKATIAELKASLLPMLKGINSVLSFLRPIVSSILDVVGKVMGSGAGKWILAGAGMFLTAAMALKGIGKAIIAPLKEIMATSVKSYAQRRLTQTIGGGVAKTASQTLGQGIPESGSQMLGRGKMMEGAGKGKMMEGAGKGATAAGIGAGIGLAAAGVGAGIGLAAEGISKLADAMSKLDEKKVIALQGIVRSISIMVGIGAVAAAVIIGIGVASGAAAPEIGLLSLGILGIGAGIGLATAGIGAMGFGIAAMIDSTKGAAKGIGDVVLGVSALGIAMAGGGIASLLGGGAMVMGLKSIGAQAPAITQIGDAFKEINLATASSEGSFQNIKETIAAISNMDVSKLAPFKDLKDIFSKPLQVEFSKDKVAITSDITLNIDSKRLMSSFNVGTDAIVQSGQQIKGGRGSNSITS